MVPPLKNNVFMKINTMETVWFVGKTLVNTSIFPEVLGKEDQQNCFEAIAGRKQNKKKFKQRKNEKIHRYFFLLGLFTHVILDS